MRTRRNIVVALLGVVIFASIVLLFSLFIQPILPPEANYILLLFVAAVTGVVVILGEINNISELFAKWTGRREGEEVKSVARLVTTNESTQLHDFDVLWKELTDSQMQNAIKDHECVWIIPWSSRPVESVRLIYDKDFSRWKRYDNIMSELSRNALERWRLKKPDDFNQYEQGPWGEQVRLEKIKPPHDAHSYETRIHLSPTKFLYYVAIQAQLGESENMSLRERTFRNALMGLREREILELPSQFAVHIAVVSCDGKVLLRQRVVNTPLYPEAWEAGVGEFMHGPEHKTKFPHFDENGNPNLSLYLKNAVAEELIYSEAKPDDFRLRGFAVEYLTLAPKLLVVYKSDAPMEILLEGARHAKDSTPTVSAVRLTPRGIAQALHEYKKWGPTSKLAMMLALTQDASPKEEVSICKEVASQIAKIEQGR